MLEGCGKQERMNKGVGVPLFLWAWECDDAWSRVLAAECLVFLRIESETHASQYTNSKKRRTRMKERQMRLRAPRYRMHRGGKNGCQQFGVLQRVRACCSVLQSNRAAELAFGSPCVAVCCSLLQCARVCYLVQVARLLCCSVLQCVAVCCSVLQCAAGGKTRCWQSLSFSVLRWVAACCSVTGRQDRSLAVVESIRDWIEYLCVRIYVWGAVDERKYMQISTEKKENKKEKKTLVLLPPRNTRVMSHNWMSHVTHVFHCSVNGQEWVTSESRMWMRNVAYKNEPCRTSESVMPHRPSTTASMCTAWNMRSCQTHSLMLNTWMSYQTHEWVIKHMNESNTWMSYQTHEWVKHMNELSNTWMSQTHEWVNTWMS